MLPYSDSLLKSIALKEDGVEGKTQLFEVQDGKVAVHSGRVLVAISNFSPLPDGQYQFGTNESATGQALFPWLLDQDNERPHRVRLPLALVARIYKVVKVWFACKPKDPKGTEEDMIIIPYVKLILEKVAAYTFNLHIEGEGVDGLPELNMDISVDLVNPDTFADHTFCFNAKELLDALAPFGRLNAKEGDLLIDYSDDDQPIWLATEFSGHDIVVGLPFVAKHKAVEVTVTFNQKKTLDQLNNAIVGALTGASV